MSVTDRKLTNSRNAAIVYCTPLGCDCGAMIMMYQAVDGAGQAIRDAKPIGMHCLSCHSSGHNACVECGACLPDWSPLPPLFPDEPRRRSDARYCKDACRQKAYRKRKAVG